MSSTPPPPLTPSPEGGLTENERVTAYIEMWKQATQVNQHFNDIEWRIRGLALTAATFVIGAAGVAAHDGETFLGVSVGTVLLIVGLVIWYAFYFVDLAWYHQLLRASVRQTEAIEREIGKSLPLAGLAKAITQGSPYQPNGVVKWLSRTPRPGAMHSTDKLKWFYLVGATALLAVAVALQLYTSFHTDKPTAPTRVEIVHTHNT